MGAASPQPSDPTAAVRKTRWRETLIVLAVLAGVIAVGVFGPDRREGQEPSATPATQSP